MEHDPDPHPELAQEPQGQSELPGFRVQMMDNGDGTVRVVTQLGSVDPWVALTMLGRAQLSVIAKVEELEAARKAADEAAQSRLIVPGRPLLRVNGN